MRVAFGLRVRLERYFKSRFPLADTVCLGPLEQVTEGFSQETFFVDVETIQGDQREGHRYVIKRAPAAGLLEPYDLQPEFRVLHALAATAFPAPPTPWFESDPSVLGRPFYVMERLDGEAPIAARDQHGRLPFSEDERPQIAVELMETLATLHGLDWRAMGLEFLGNPGPGAAARELDRWEQRLHQSRLDPHPAVVEALLWLRANIPLLDQVVLVHGDYRLGNFLFTREEGEPHLTGVLDWEMVHLGDALEDLAWCLCPLWRAGSDLACTVAAPAEMVRLYEQATGHAVAPARLQFYQVFSLVKMIGIMSCGVAAYRDGRTDDLRMAIFEHQLPALHDMLGRARGWKEDM